MVGFSFFGKPIFFVEFILGKSKDHVKQLLLFNL